MTSQLPKNWLDSLVDVIHHDPGGRGVAAYRLNDTYLDQNGLSDAAHSLATHATAVGIVTGFCIATAEPPAAETDGPPGALVLARVLGQLGLSVDLLSDHYGMPLLIQGCRRWGLPESMLIEIPFESERLDAPARGSHARCDSPHTLAWIDKLLATRAASWTHLISIERAGPSHTHDAVPRAERDLCHNMRGINITPYTAKAHWLFEIIRQRSIPITTIGIADGGNEIGMGNVAWSVLCNAIGVGPGEITACRIPTDHLILAGVSNWGGYALAAAVAKLRDQVSLVDAINAEELRALVVSLVEEAGAVDGVTRRREASVDGLGLDICCEVWRRVQAIVRG